MRSHIGFFLHAKARTKSSISHLLPTISYISKKCQIIFADRIKQDIWSKKCNLSSPIAISAIARLNHYFGPSRRSAVTDTNELRPGQIDEWNTNSGLPGNMLRWDHSSCYGFDRSVSFISLFSAI